MEQAKRKKGFAAMDPQRQREIASVGGKTAHRTGNAHEFTPEEAKAARARRTQLDRQRKEQA